MKQYMLMFSLGPVQTFIAQARKTRDLWLGSYLLSRLMAAGMADIENLVSQFIFPTYRKVDGVNANLANKYIAIFDSLEKAQEAVELNKEGIRSLWNTIRRDVWMEIVKDYATAETITIWQRQSDPDTFFEFFWVIVAGDPSDYPAWLSRTQEAFDARKRLRDFRLKDEGGEKSTITGEGEALHGWLDDKESIRIQVKQYWQTLARRKGSTKKALSAKDINLDGEERLDAIDAIKRFATVSSKIPNDAFPSTSSVATASFVEELIRHYHDLPTIDRWLQATSGPLAEMPPGAIPYLNKMAKEIPGAIEILKRDGDLYFPETFTSYRLRQDYDIADESRTKSVAERGRRALSALLNDTDAHNIIRPTPYYAMIQMDGDKMGVLLNQVESDKEHIAISTALSHFSRMIVRPLVEERYPGRLIYAGGDDVFALAPLARDTRATDENITVLKMIDELRKQYHNTVALRVTSEERRQNVTASIGIAIAHHFTSLSYVRRVSKEAETLAKEHYGRNALVVTIIRRSGEQTRVGCHWYYDRVLESGEKRHIESIPLFQRFYELFKDDVLSPKCVYNLLEEADTLVGLEETAQQSEIRRVLQRQYDKNKASKLRSKDELATHAIQLVDLAEAMDSDQKDAAGKKQKMAVDLHSDQLRYGLVEVFGWLLVAAFLARKEQE